MPEVIFIAFVAGKGSKFNPLCDPHVELLEIKEIWNAKEVQTQAPYSTVYTAHSSPVPFPPPPRQDIHSHPPPADFYWIIPDVEACLSPNCV